MASAETEQPTGFSAKEKKELRRLMRFIDGLNICLGCGNVYRPTKEYGCPLCYVMKK